MCRYHPERYDIGACAKCGHGYCGSCAVPYGKTHEDTQCADCGAETAKKRLRIVHIATVAGFGLGVLMSFGAISDLTSAPFALGSVWSVLYAGVLPFIVGYVLPCWYLGFFIQCSLCVKLAQAGENAEGWQALAYSIGAFALRLTVSLYGGIFGFGIVQYRRLVTVVDSRDGMAVAHATT